MRVLRLDLLGGAAGDMLLAALIDAGADAARIEEWAGALGYGPIRFRTEPVREHGIVARRLTVEYGGDLPSHGGHAPHRAWRDICDRLEAAPVPAAARDMAARVFARLAAAEGAIHGIEPDAVQFHEIGALDSIADIFGACAAMTLLEIEAVTAGPFPVGRGTVHCAHGEYPLPAPAVVALLRGQPVVEVDEETETVTPTGAALVVEWVGAAVVPPGPKIIRSVGYGAGHRPLRGRPNLVRAIVEETPADAAASADECVVLQTNLDDATGECVGALVDALLREGALDAYTTPVQMKKQRPGVAVTALCEPALRTRLVDVFFRHSPTFGVREHAVRRTVLERRWEMAHTRYGDVRVKYGVWMGRTVTRAPEMSDCIARADACGVAAREVYEEALRLASRD